MYTNNDLPPAEGQFSLAQDKGCKQGVTTSLTLSTWGKQSAFVYL